MDEIGRSLGRAAAAMELREGFVIGPCAECGEAPVAPGGECWVCGHQDWREPSCEERRDLFFSFCIDYWDALDHWGLAGYPSRAISESMASAEAMLRDNMRAGWLALKPCTEGGEVRWAEESRPSLAKRLRSLISRISQDR